MSIATPRRYKRRSNKVIKYVVAAVTAMAVANALIELAAPLSKQRFKRSRIKYVATPEGDVCTQIIGDSPVALLIHDLQPGSSMDDFVAVEADGSPAAYVAIDLLGYGRSDRPATTYNITMHADHVEEVLAQFPTITNIVAVGYAASIAITVANRNVNGRTIVMIDPTYAAAKSLSRSLVARVPILGPFVYHIRQILADRRQEGPRPLDDRFGNVHRSGSENVTHGPEMTDLCESIILPVDSDVHVIHMDQDDSDEGWNKVRGIVFSE
jgi:pimeloyl-ACP methyl ester carboxylesterase